MNENYKLFFSMFGRSEKEEIWCTKAVNHFWIAEREHVIKVADDVCSQKFIFDMPWDMEPTNKPVSFERKILWEYKPDEDMEFVYQMNRHRYWTCLGQAYCLTKNEKYAKAFIFQMLDWIESNPLNSDTSNTVW